MPKRRNKSFESDTVDPVSSRSQSQAAKWILVVLVALVAVCVGARDPASAIAAGKDSIDAAVSAGAARLAPQALAAAVDKLERARALHRTGRGREALRLAEKATEDARAAQAIAAAAQRRDVSVVEADKSAWSQLRPVAATAGERRERR